MKEPVKVESNEHYNELLNSFLNKLKESYPKNELISINVEASPKSTMTYGSSAVDIIIKTVSYYEKYIIWINNKGYFEFIRCFGD